MRIGIVGLGLIGGSLGLDLRGLGHEVFGVSRQQETCEIAQARGVVDQAESKPEILSPCDLVFLCPPIGQIFPVAQAIQPHLKPDAILTDVGSVKTAIVQPLTQLWPRFVGGHPMAGTAESGILAAQKDLFAHRPYVLTPLPKTDPQAMTVMREVVNSLQAQLYIATPAAHDRAVAWISHLPVIVSAALLGACDQEANSDLAALAVALASSGFRDTSRVGGGNPELGRMMAEFNRQELLYCLQIYQQQVAGLISKIEQQDWPGLQAYLDQQSQNRPKFLKEA